MSDPCRNHCQFELDVLQSISTREALNMMDQRDIHHLPVVDAKNDVIKFLLRKDLVAEGRSYLSAEIMAGGYGKRLLPLTESVPKPMLPVGDRPMLEHVIQQLRRSGIREVNMTTHYLPESISNHFGDGNGFGVRLDDVQEESPMGTAGGVKLSETARRFVCCRRRRYPHGGSFSRNAHVSPKTSGGDYAGVRKYECRFHSASCSAKMCTSRACRKSLH